MPFSAEQVEEMQASVRDATSTLRRVMLQSPQVRLENTLAREYFLHGFLRRFTTLEHCLRTVFRLLAPGDTSVPDKDIRKHAEVAIQAFVFNAFGAIDNLAWIWVKETGLRRQDGRELARTDVGLQPRNTIVRGTLSQPAQTQLASFNEWFEQLENFRHSLAHRVPLYIPPFCVNEHDEEEYRNYETQKAEALRRADADAYERLEAVQATLLTFQPIMTHSIGERAPTVVFHPQLIADFNTVDSIRSLIFEELEARARALNA